MLSGSLLRDAIISAANNISNNRKHVDAMNVFPVPDGDTGTNMSMTIGAARRELLLRREALTVAEAAQTAANALLRGARGNSGVILSLLFRGFAKGMQGVKNATAADISAALEIGVNAAYKAVMKPTEGTILTVARQSSIAAKKSLETNPDLNSMQLWNIVVDAAKESLETTPELLPVLKKAGVVDAGGKGLVIIFEGMSSVFSGSGIISEKQAASSQIAAEIPVEKNAAGEYEGEITFTYCTEFIVLRGSQASDAIKLRAFLESIGDSAVVADDDEIIKCHIHTDNPGSALQKALEYGQLTGIKIDNMREQHITQKRAAAQMASSAKSSLPYAQVDPERQYGFVSVAAGSGIASVFRDLGVDHVVNGGQTMNPSTDDILEAVHATPAKTVIVLPNNKNIIMAAEQTVKLADRGVYVLPTKTVPQGFASLLAFDPERELGENQLNMIKAIERVSTGLVTFAARDSQFDGHKIRKGEILGIENGKVALVEKDINRAVLKVVRSLVGRSSTFVTLIYGEEVTEQQAEELKALVQQKLPDNVELALIGGGQPVYYYMISVE